MLRLFLWLTFFSLQTGAQLAGPMADNIFKNITVRSQALIPIMHEGLRQQVLDFNPAPQKNITAPSI